MQVDRHGLRWFGGVEYAGEIVESLRRLPWVSSAEELARHAAADSQATFSPSPYMLVASCGADIIDAIQVVFPSPAKESSARGLT